MIHNQYGLPRAIPEAVAREVRQRCGFGCVICGSAIVDYEHFAPEFKDARQHSAEGITLLCPQCHARKTRNQLSDRRVREANAAPFCKREGFSFEQWDPSLTHPYVIFGGCTLRNCAIPIRVGAFPMFEIEQPETVGGPYRLSAFFFDRTGMLVLALRRNVWQAASNRWDITNIGGAITIRYDLRDIALQIRFVPDEGIVVDRADMLVAGYRIEGDRNRMLISNPEGGQLNLQATLIDGCHVGMQLG